MGSALTVRAIEAGFSVIAYDVVPEKVTSLAGLGVASANCFDDIVEQAEWIVFSVMTTDQVKGSLESAESHLRSGQVIIDCSTGEPDQMHALGDWLQSYGVEYLDATIAGNSQETRAGEVLALVGGSAQGFEQCQPFFQSFAKASFHLGPTGYGARMKLVFNLVLGLNRAVLAEALRFSEKLGIPSPQALEILKQGTAYSYVMDNKGEKMVTEDFAPQAKLAQHLKDVRLILELAERNGATTPLTSTHRQLLESLESAGLGELDNSAIIKAF